MHKITKGFHGAIHRVLWDYTGLCGTAQGYIRLHRGTQGYIRLHRITWGYTQGSMELHRVTWGYMYVHRVTYSYTGKHGAIQGHIRLQRVTWGYKWLHRITEFCPQKKLGTASLKQACISILWSPLAPQLTVLTI